MRDRIERSLVPGGYLITQAGAALGAPSPPSQPPIADRRTDDRQLTRRVMRSNIRPVPLAVNRRHAMETNQSEAAQVEQTKLSKRYPAERHQRVVSNVSEKVAGRPDLQIDSLPIRCDHRTGSSGFRLACTRLSRNSVGAGEWV